MIKLLEMIGETSVNESDFRKRFRLHQGWWRAFVLGENQGKRPQSKKEDDKICSTILNGEQSNNNFISKTVSNTVINILENRKDKSSGVINKNRLYNNLLSSQPLCFNFFAPLSKNMNKKIALKFLQKFYPNITAVNEVHFEFGNTEDKIDNSAFDVAFDVNEGNKKGIIGFECKYTDSFSPKIIRKPSYEKIYQKSDIWEKSYKKLTASKFNQLFRNQLIGESFKQNNSKYDFAYLALFCHHKDTIAIKIADEYKLMLKKEKSNHFQIITYKDYFEIMMQLDLSWNFREFLMLLWARYCGLELSASANKQLKKKS